MKNIYERAREIIGKDVIIDDVEISGDIVLIYYNDSGESFGSMREVSKETFYGKRNISKEVFVLSEIIEDETLIRETNILKISHDINKLREYMEELIKKDQYGFISKNGVDTHEEDYFETNYEDGFFALTITDHIVV